MLEVGTFCFWRNSKLTFLSYPENVLRILPVLLNYVKALDERRSSKKTCNDVRIVRSEKLVRKRIIINLNSACLLSFSV